MVDELIAPDLLRMLIFPLCKSDVLLKNGQLVCQNTGCSLKFPIVNGIPIMRTDFGEDFQLTKEKWEKEYEDKYDFETVNLLNTPEVRHIYMHVKKYLF